MSTTLPAIDKLALFQEASLFLNFWITGCQVFSLPGLAPTSIPKFWLFEPRCDMHDIGGWYIETYSRDKKGRTVPSRRYWDVFDSNGESDKRLHPAVYLFGTAYRTLDIEQSRRRKLTWRSVFEQKLGQILRWGRQLAQFRT